MQLFRHLSGKDGAKGRWVYAFSILVNPKDEIFVVYGDGKHSVLNIELRDLIYLRFLT